MKPKQIDWMLLKLSMTKKNRDLLASMDEYLDERTLDFLRQLKHDVDYCNDPKSFYEKEVPYRMESLTITDLRHITKMISQGFANNLYWLQNNLRNFGITKLELPFVDYSIHTDDHQQDDLDLMNIHKTKLYTRAGTLVTAICLSGFGVGFFIASLLFGTGAEELFLSHSKKSKEKIKSKLPDIVENYKSQLKLHILESMAKPHSIIIDTLNNLSYEQTKLQQF